MVLITGWTGDFINVSCRTQNQCYVTCKMDNEEQMQKKAPSITKNVYTFNIIFN